MATKTLISVEDFEALPEDGVQLLSNGERDGVLEAPGLPSGIQIPIRGLLE